MVFSSVCLILTLLAGAVIGQGAEEILTHDFSNEVEVVATMDETEVSN